MIDIPMRRYHEDTKTNVFYLTVGQIAGLLQYTEVKLDSIQYNNDGKYKVIITDSHTQSLLKENTFEELKFPKQIRWTYK